jgi:hypothetical protein
MRLLAGAGLLLAGGYAASEAVREFVIGHYIITVLAFGVLAFLQWPEWRGGVTSILTHDDARKMVNVNSDVEGYEKLYGKDSRYVSFIDSRSFAEAASRLMLTASSLLCAASARAGRAVRSTRSCWALVTLCTLRW